MFCRRQTREIIIVNCDGHWWDATGRTKGVVFNLVQQHSFLNFGQVRRLLRGFIGVVPAGPKGGASAGSATEKTPNREAPFATGCAGLSLARGETPMTTATSITPTYQTLSGLPAVDFAVNVRAALATGRRARTIAAETLTLRFGAGRLSPQEYFYYRLWEAKLPLTAKRAYVSKMAQHPMHVAAGSREWYATAADKILFHSVMAGARLPVPETLVITQAGRHLPDVPIIDEADVLARFLREPSIYPFFAKPVDGKFSLDYHQVVQQMADLYIERRDHLQIAGSQRAITISTLTNEDGADISQAIRKRLQARGEISTNEKVYEAIDQRGVTYYLPIAAGDSLRLFRKTWASIDGKGGSLGSNGDVMTVLGEFDRGLILRNRDGQVGEVEWRRVLDKETGRLLGYGHALTVDAAQGITCSEHINALPRGTAAVTAFRGYVAESRSTGTTWTVISEAAVHEAERRSRALGDAKPITAEDLWSRVATDMSAKPYKALGIDLLKVARRDREAAVAAFIDDICKLQATMASGRNLGREARERVQAKAMARQLERHIAAL